MHAAQNRCSRSAILFGGLALLAGITAVKIYARQPAALGAPQTATRTAEKSAPAKASGSTAKTAERAASEAGKPLSTRVVAYDIDATLDPVKHTIRASETLTYKNLTGQPQQTFPFHLYLNAFQPTSTFMTEVRLNGTRGTTSDTAWDPKHYGAIAVTQFEVAGEGDLTDKMQFIQPDDHNTADHTVFQVTLPKAVAPGESVEFKMKFEDQLPRVSARTGYVRDFNMIGQWFPKVGVWWHGAWNCHQFHATSEFFADFGTFDVKLTVPQNEILGAGGDLVSTTEHPDGTKTVEYRAEDTHDFSWTASPHFRDVEDSWQGSGGPVKIHLLMSPGDMSSARRYLKALKGTLTLYDKWFGTYPYDRITVVDPPHGGLDAGGMEYPTLITAGTQPRMPRGALLPEIVVEHEFGHQYWYGMVATNEFEDAWLDEGINSYVEVKVMDALYGKNSALNFHFGQMSEDELQRTSYLALPDTDPLTHFSWNYINSTAYGGITYGKTATALLTLEKIIGEDKMRESLRVYFERYRFQHPTTEDFLKTIEEVSGQDLSWYFNQAVYGTNMLDYEIFDAHSDPVKWYESSESKAGTEAKGPYHTYVTVRRKGDFVAPVDIEVKFEDGKTATEHWDGKERWIRYEYTGDSKLAWAAVDPQHKLSLDSNFFNNSYSVKADMRATHKLENLWIFGEELISQLVAWLT